MKTLLLTLILLITPLASANDNIDLVDNFSISSGISLDGGDQIHGVGYGVQYDITESITISANTVKYNTGKEGYLANNFYHETIKDKSFNSISASYNHRLTDSQSVYIKAGAYNSKLSSNIDNTVKNTTETGVLLAVGARVSFGRISLYGEMGRAGSKVASIGIIFKF
tara:strand:- start:15 stop:518 length:504 start_codon:yes stop_codon:yes gene_type:complete